MDGVEEGWKYFITILIEAVEKGCGRTVQRRRYLGNKKGNTTDEWNEITIGIVREKNK